MKSRRMKGGREERGEGHAKSQVQLARVLGGLPALVHATMTRWEPNAKIALLFYTDSQPCYAALRRAQTRLFLRLPSHFYFPVSALFLPVFVLPRGKQISSSFPPRFLLVSRRNAPSFPPRRKILLLLLLLLSAPEKETRSLFFLRDNRFVRLRSYGGKEKGEREEFIGGERVSVREMTYRYGKAGTSNVLSFRR